MATKPQRPEPTGTPVFDPTVPVPLERPYVLGDALPIPEVIEKNSDSVWQLWSDATEDPAEQPRFKDTVPQAEDQESEPEPATRIMGLDELPDESGKTPQSPRR